MQSEAIAKIETEVDSPCSTTNITGTSDTTNGATAEAPGKVTETANGTANAQFPPPKTDKPRPHVCTTCGRSFARLEHLKRHERSHTKEKPFECPECTRCFARRDLLLRHQQKLHMTNTTARGPRSGRRESVSGTSVAGSGKVRKNSVANANVGGLASNTTRPRANTISHLDIASLGIFDGSHPGLSRVNSAGMDSSHIPASNMPAPMGFDFRTIPETMGHQISVHGLPKLNTSINGLDMSNTLRTAPPQQTNFSDLDFDPFFSPNTTVNPAALHFGSGANVPTTNMPYGSFDMQTMPIDDDFGWMRAWNMQQLQSGFENEQAIEESSPSRMSSDDSPPDYNDNLGNGNMGIPIHSGTIWQQHDAGAQPNMNPQAFQLDSLSSGMASMDPSNDTLSPAGMHDPTPTADTYFHQAMMQQNGQQHAHQLLLHPQQQHQPHQRQSFSQPATSQNGLEMMPGPSPQFGAQTLSNFGSDSPSISISSMNGSARQSSVTSMSTESITDSTRQALLASLSQPSVFSAQNARKYSQPAVSSPLSPNNARLAMSSQGPTLPSTSDIKRYIEAFIRYASPHLPCVHIPTVSFDTIELGGSPLQGLSPKGATSQAAGSGGARCLILGMAAIGALYEYDHPASKELFEAAKKMISLYLEERRRADMSAVVNGGSVSGETPLWLVQAMLLSVIYGHHCGDRTSADIASNHIAALVSLARAANLSRSPVSKSSTTSAGDKNGADVEMGDSTSGASPVRGADLHAQWCKWKVGEERKRVFYAIFILSSLLTTAYNHPPTIMNSEIMLDLPCAEELWVAETAEEWQNCGGAAAAERTSISFATALSTLLMASERKGAGNPPNGGDAPAEPELKPSTAGCLVLINALHNYIWETRNRHHGKEWTAQETEAMFAHIEPALNAWQTAWKSHEHHRLERPNPFGLGPLSADSIPLLDLAFVRLFVNLGRTAEQFWKRDFDAMADQLANGTDVVIAAAPLDHGSEAYGSCLSASTSSPGHLTAVSGAEGASPGQNSLQTASRRERYLRKAAYYAADSLTIACNYNLTYADQIAPELPIQSAICFFDCGQVLGEWVTSVQERVGRFIGVIGQDVVDYTQVPAIMLLEAEDVELLQKIEQICANLEGKRQQHEALLSMDFNGLNSTATVANGQGNADPAKCGLGSKILRSIAMLLEKAVIWPITHVMAKGLQVEANHMDRRTTASCQR